MNENKREHAIDETVSEIDSDVENLAFDKKGKYKL